MLFRSIYGEEKQWERFSPAEASAETQAYMSFGKDNAKSIQGGNALQPTPTAKTVRVRNGKSLVTDGPFMETKELIAGYWVWKVKSVDEALEWLKRAPFRDGEVEIRPFFEPEDFGENLTLELHEQQERIREEMLRQSSRH